MRGGDGGDLLEAVDLRGALAHRDDMSADPEDLGHPPLQGAGTPGLDEADPYDTLLAGTRQEPGDGRARHPQVVGDHLHRLALDVVHGGRLVGAQKAAGVGGTRGAPGRVSSGSASHVFLLAPPAGDGAVPRSPSAPWAASILPPAASAVAVRRTVRTGARTFLWIPQKPTAHSCTHLAHSPTRNGQWCPPPHKGRTSATERSGPRRRKPGPGCIPSGTPVNADRPLTAPSVSISRHVGAQEP